MRGFQYATEFEGIALNLNYSKLIEKRAFAHDNPAAYIGDRFTEKLRVHDLADLPFAIVLEFSPDGRLHVHGLIVHMGKPHLAISRALCEAGGKLFGKAAARQLTLKPLFDDQGCKSYCLKTNKATNVLLAG